MCEIIGFLAPSDLHVSLNSMSSRSVHVVVDGPELSFLRAEQDSIVCLYHIFFIGSCTEGHFGCFHVLAALNDAAMCTGGAFAPAYQGLQAFWVDARWTDCRAARSSCS